MMNVFRVSLLLMTIALLPCKVGAQNGQLSPLHVEGPFLVDADSKRHNLHGFAQTFSPWFNEQGSKWSNYDVEACLKYNKGIIDGIMNAGWKMTFVRQHMDPYWSNTPGQQTAGENDISAFDFNRFRTYLDKVFIPMAEYAISKGLYVVMRPPGVCPENICLGDAYQQYLVKVWRYVAQRPKLKNNGAVMFELANEPVHIINSDGTRAGDKEMTEYFQAIVDTIRHYDCNNILLIPGLGWQSSYAGYAKYPIKGDNIGYAVHCYPGWYNGGHGDDDVVVNYRDFKRGWDAQIMPVAVTNPIVVTEMDWAPTKYKSSWGKSNTGEEGKTGFGANFKRIADETRNVSWLIFTGGELLAQYDANAADGNTFLTDPEACPRPCYSWYQYYASEEYNELINQETYRPEMEEHPLFALTADAFNPSIWEKGTFDESTGSLVTGKYGFGGWEYPQGADLSKWKYLVVELKQQQNVGASFRLFDINNYWTSPYRVSFANSTRLVIDLHQLKAYKDDACTLFDHDVDPSHIYIAGIWTYGGTPIYIKDVYLSDDGQTPSAIVSVENGEVVLTEYYTLGGQKTSRPAKGINIVKQVLNNGKTTIFKKCYK